ncbi:cobalt transporter [Pseudorhodobacter sp. E13]|nr:cobalt transporter [Pseudorhodobacter sp. E13]
MIQRMVTSALIAGFVAGLLAALLHFAFVQQYILLGEQYESGALTHFNTPAPVAEHSDHAATAEHDHGTHSHDGDAAPTGLTRNALTVLFAGLIYVAYALLLTAGFGLAQSFGILIDARKGLLWGIAGFFSFQLAPAIGLAPELPGTIAADLTARQIWWWGTVLATGTGLALLAYGKDYIATVAAVVLLAAPHVIGAPLPDAYWGSAPPEVGAIFSARVLGTALVVWAVLGWLAGQLWAKDAE